jgi:hypothetical protein
MQGPKQLLLKLLVLNLLALLVQKCRFWRCSTACTPAACRVPSRCCWSCT